MPFQRISPEDVSVRVERCQLCGALLSTERMPGGAEKVVEDIFVGSLMLNKRFEIIPPERAGAIFEMVSSASLKATLQENLKKTGSELGADGIVIGYVYRYRERKGFAYGTDETASVGFDIHLMRVLDGTIVWRGIFDKKQRSLTEDVLQISSFFKDRGRFITAKELATEGIEAILEQFPGLKREGTAK